jgi:hypothetical protein
VRCELRQLALQIGGLNFKLPAATGVVMAIAGFRQHVCRPAMARVVLDSLLNNGETARETNLLHILNLAEGKAVGNKNSRPASRKILVKVMACRILMAASIICDAEVQAAVSFIEQASQRNLEVSLCEGELIA